MPTLRVSESPVRLVLPIGQVLTVTAPAGSSAYVVEPETLVPALSIASQSQKVGPYEATKNITLTCTTGAISYEVSEAPSTVVTSTDGGTLIGIANGRKTIKGWPLNRMFRAALDCNQSTPAAQPSMTWQHMVQCDAPFDAVRPIVMHSTSAQAGVTFACASGADWSDKTGNALTWVAGTWAGGSSSGTLAVGTAARPSVNVPDMCYVQSLARTDGGSGAIAYVRLYLPTAGSAAQCLHQSGDYSQISGLTKGAMYVNRWAGDGVSVIANYSPGAGRLDSPIWGFEFLCRGQVVGVVAVGDSITAGTGSTILRRNWAERAAITNSATGSIVAFGSANGGFPGQTSSQYVLRALDLITALTPPVMVYSPWTPNDFPGAGGPVTATVINLMRANLAKFVAACRAVGTLPVIWTGLPCPSKGINAASDQLRKDFNAEIRATYGTQVIVWDADAVMSNGASPAGFLPGMSADDLHPTDAGYDALAAKFWLDALGPVVSVNTGITL